GILVGSYVNEVRTYVSAFSIEDPTLHALDGIPPGQWPEAADVLIGIGAIAGCVLLFMLVSKIVPVISMWEVGEGLRLTKVRRYLNRQVRVIAKSH
ncbi:MAG: hypothetical protein IIC94_08800, partial [Chloroflexi bacterium]|nr:hypothetical protein [Chloroflexota bacterium]